MCTVDVDEQALVLADQALGQTIINGKATPYGFYGTNSPDYDGSNFTDTEFGLAATITIVSTSISTVLVSKSTSAVVPPAATAQCNEW